MDIQIGARTIGLTIPPISSLTFPPIMMAI